MFEQRIRNLETIESKDIVAIPTNNQRSTWRNFAGKLPGYKGQIPPYGSFNVYINKAKADELKQKKYNVKEWTTPDGDTRYRLDIAVRYDQYPPNVYMKTDGKTKLVKLNEDTIGVLDTAEIVDADLMIHGSQNRQELNAPLKAYLHVGYFTIADSNYFGGKYDVDEEDESAF